MRRFMWRKREFLGVIGPCNSLVNVEIYCAIYLKRWQTKLRYVVELVLPEYMCQALKLLVRV